MKEGREKLKLLGFDENDKNTLVFFKTKENLVFSCKMK
jgi:hypothetical protein